MPKFPVASHTFLNTWENCPWKAYRQYIAKDLPRSPASSAMTWGITCHSALEARLKHGTPFPPEMTFEKFAAPLAAAGAKAELPLAIDEQGNSVDFWDRSAWLRGKLDATIVKGVAAVIADLKTGRRREEKAELETHAVLLKAKHPELQRINAFYFWTQEGTIGKVFDVSDTEKKLAEIRQTMETVKNCMEVEDFPKRPNPLCGGEWGSCPVEDCEHRKGPR